MAILHPSGSLGVNETRQSISDSDQIRSKVPYGLDTLIRWELINHQFNPLISFIHGYWCRWMHPRCRLARSMETKSGYQPPSLTPLRTYQDSENARKAAENARRAVEMQKAFLQVKFSLNPIALLIKPSSTWSGAHQLGCKLLWVYFVIPISTCEVCLFWPERVW